MAKLPTAQASLCCRDTVQGVLRQPAGAIQTPSRSPFRPAVLRRANCALPAAALCHAVLTTRRSSTTSLLRQARLGATPSDEDSPSPEQPLASTNPPLEVEQQNERALAYATVTAVLGAAGLASVVAPQQCIELLWQASPALVVAGLARGVGAALLLAAVCANCLKAAAEHDRLRSDTYLRLNLALMLWAMGTVASLWLAPLQPRRLVLGLCTAVLAATSGHAALTYHETSERGLDPAYIFGQFLGSLTLLGNYSSQGNTALLPLYGYGLAAKAAMAAAAAILLRGQLWLSQQGGMLAPLGTLGASLLPAVGCGYLLLAVVLFTLKDAAARARLGASTFKALNIGVAITSLTGVVVVASWVKGGIASAGVVTAFVAAVYAALAALALYEYAFEQHKRVSR